VLEDQNGIPNWYFAPKMGPGGPKRGPVADLGAQKGLPGIEVSPVWSPKWIQKSMEKRNKNQGGFGGASGERFSRFWLQNGAKMEPVGCRKRHKNDLWSQKRIFTPIHIFKWFRQEIWGSGPPCWHPERARIHEDTEVEICVGVLRFLSDFASILGGPN
jgi:hypothetical protein